LHLFSSEPFEQLRKISVVGDLVVDGDLLGDPPKPGKQMRV
jgi:hypothetical protein